MRKYPKSNDRGRKKIKKKTNIKPISGKVNEGNQKTFNKFLKNLMRPTK